MSSPGAAPIVENVTGNGKGVKRAPEEQPSDEQDVDRSSYPSAAKTVKSNPAAAAAAAAIASDNKVDATAVDSREREHDEVEDPKNAARSTDSERVEAEALLSLGLSVGTRLEVMWLLEEDGQSNEKWWGCSVAGARTGERDDSGFPVFTLHYDSYQTFEEANHDVSFVDKYRLVHLEDGAEMTWKREGEEVDREAVMASLADEAVDLQEVMEAQDEEDAEAGGETIEIQGMRELAQLPQHQQMAMAAGYRRMADVVKEHLRVKMQQQQQGGGEAVVSAADIENMFRDVRAGGVNGAA